MEARSWTDWTFTLLFSFLTICCCALFVCASLHCCIGHYCLPPRITSQYCLLLGESTSDVWNLSFVFFGRFHWDILLEISLEYFIGLFLLTICHGSISFENISWGNSVCSWQSPCDCWQISFETLRIIIVWESPYCNRWNISWDTLVDASCDTQTADSQQTQLLQHKYSNTPFLVCSPIPHIFGICGERKYVIY